MIHYIVTVYYTFNRGLFCVRSPPQRVTLLAAFVFRYEGDDSGGSAMDRWDRALMVLAAVVWLILLAGAAVYLILERPW